jgi:hypothetical protein
MHEYVRIINGVIMPDLIRGAVLKGVPELVAQLGANPEELLRANGFNISDLQSPDTL